MNTIKLNVTIELPGRTMLSTRECEENPEENYEYGFATIISNYYDKKERKWVNKKKLKKVIIGRKCAPAYQSINMSDEAYDYMMSSTYPEWLKGGLNAWKKLSPKQKLETHLERICQSLNGKRYTYTVFED